jgi:excisionase family DNA binding protein
MKKKEVAETLQISERQVDYLRQAGDLPCIKIGRSVRFRSEDVEQLLNRLVVSTENTTPSTTKGA